MCFQKYFGAFLLRPKPVRVMRFTKLLNGSQSLNPTHSHLLFGFLEIAGNKDSRSCSENSG